MIPGRRILPYGACLLVLAAILHATASRRPPRGADLPELGRIPDFELTDAAGRSVRRRDLKGPWVASFFYTRCTGQCPLLTARLQGLSHRLRKARLVTFSLDPRDTPEDLAAYAARHRAGWLLLAGEKARRLCRDAFKLPYGEGADPREPIVHSSKLVLVDARGMIRGYFDADAAEDVERLARGVESLAPEG